MTLIAQFGTTHKRKIMIFSKEDRFLSLPDMKTFEGILP